MAQHRDPLVPLYFAPDLDQSWDVNPGICNSIYNYVPTKRGTFANYANGPSQDMGASNTWVVATYGLPATGYIFKAVSGAAASARMFACTFGAKRRILELASSGATTDRSLGGLDYAACPQWTMTSQGNAILAANGVDQMQVSTGAAFGNLGGSSPTGALCLTSNLGFVLAGYKGDGTNADAVGWSALGNYADWVPSLATQAGNYRLLDTPGPIRALIPLRDSVIAYKDDSIYIGDYIGDTVNGVLWGWRVISDKIGCSSPHGVGVLNNTHYFLHKTGIYAFDGTQVVNIGNGVQKEILSRVGDAAMLVEAQTGVDEREGIIYFGFSNTPGRINYLLMLNVNTGRWGGCVSTAGVAWQESANTGLLYAFVHAGLGDLVQWNTSLTWDMNSIGSGPVCIGSPDNGTNVNLRQPRYNVAIIAAGVGSAFIRSGQLTIGPGMSCIRRLTPRLLYFGPTQTATPAATFRHARREGESLSAPPSPPLYAFVSPNPVWNPNNYCFDGSGAGTADRVLQFDTTFAGPHELGGVWVDLKQAGNE